MKVVTYRSSRWEVVSDGCPTALEPKNCPHYPHSLTVYLLGRNGQRRPGGTSCIDESKATYSDDICDECRNPFDDNPGQSMCRTCADWVVIQIPDNTQEVPDG